MAEKRTYTLTAHGDCHNGHTVGGCRVEASCRLADLPNDEREQLLESSQEDLQARHDKQWTECHKTVTPVRLGK